MFAIETSPSRSESSSTSNTDDTPSSTQSVNTVFYDFVDFQPPKGFGTDLSRVKNGESPSPHQESSEEEYSGPWPKPKPGYTRRLIRMIRIPLDEIDEDFDEAAWNKKVYGPDVIVVDMRNVPKGWVLVDGNIPALSVH
jgi:hypothetical protein